ncbi:hypothetical protein SAMN03159338_1536 [Sphingomonas sp. NFR04]|uniref:hypothetical protein n=1 Tax=Sphingomonas sp. NFR04 TaxID=1566283 RepID=UPI0008ED1E3D|nr:hypothetical protein [Sphingomonas sp. NFR04]SFJ48838.1 hypothetical protein SAMN03159338_1536 [Sphingomonas sp. NFR04]
MDRRNDRGLLHRLMFGRGGPAPERKEMTRGQQTAWLLAAIAIVAFLAFNYMESRRDPCASIFSGGESKCRADEVMKRLGAQ